MLRETALEYLRASVALQNRKARAPQQNAAGVLRAPWMRAYRDFGERPKDAVAREVKEELGLDVIVGAPFFADLITATLSPEVRYFICFHVTLKNPTQEPSFPSDEASEVLWISKDEVETVHTFEVCRDALRAHFAQNNS